MKKKNLRLKRKGKIRNVVIQFKQLQEGQADHLPQKEQQGATKCPRLILYDTKTISSMQIWISFTQPPTAKNNF